MKFVDEAVIGSKQATAVAVVLALGAKSMYLMVVLMVVMVAMAAVFFCRQMKTSTP